MRSGPLPLNDVIHYTIPCECRIEAKRHCNRGIWRRKEERDRKRTSVCLYTYIVYALVCKRRAQRGEREREKEKGALHIYLLFPLYVIACSAFVCVTYVLSVP